MREVSKTIRAAHTMLRPIAAAHQVAPERLHDLRMDAIRNNDTLGWLRLIGAGAIKPFADTNYERALSIASGLTGRNIIGVGLEAIVALVDSPENTRPVIKFATKVNGSPRVWRDALERRHDIAQADMGKFLIDTTYSLGRVRGETEPSFIIMEQPFVDIKEDGRVDPEVADLRGEFKEAAERIAWGRGYYFDIVPGHMNLVTHMAEGEQQLGVVDMVIMSVEDPIRPFVPFLPNQAEWAGWLDSVKA